MVNEVVPTATSEIADLILPMADITECYSYKAYSSVEGGYLALGRPLRDPVGEARSSLDVEYELAEKMGFHRDYPFQDTIGWVKYMIEPTGVTFEQLEKEQIVYATPPIKYQKHVENGFNTPSGKLDFLSQMFENHGYSKLPAYTEPYGEPLDAHNTTDKGFSLLGSTRRPSQFTHTRFRELETLTELYPEPLVWIHPQDAAARDIKDGDEVEVVSSQGGIRIKAKVQEKGKSGHVIIDFGWGNPLDGKASINDLSSDAHFNPVSGATPNRIYPCEVRK
jgi:anaerobic selenocysteine-containing dehydrogenase